MHRHYSDLQVPPFGLAIASFNDEIARTMMGDSDSFSVTGNMAGWDVRRELKQIRVPTLVTVGSHDLTTLKSVKTLQHGIKNSKIVVFRKSGHDAMYKERDTYMETMKDFLDNVPN